MSWFSKLFGKTREADDERRASDRRQHPRYSDYRVVSVVSLASRKCSGTMKNISLGGCAFEPDLSWHPVDRVRLVLKTVGQPLEVTAEVVRRDRRSGEVSARFVGMDATGTARLQDYLKSNCWPIIARRRGEASADGRTYEIASRRPA